METQLTHTPYNKILTNTNVWTRDGRRIVYDVRSDREGSDFDGTRIESVDIETKKSDILYESINGACCGVATCSPADDRIVFILGPEHPTTEWSYGPTRRRGVVLSPNGATKNLDACRLNPPFIDGSLRGGSHVHVFSGDGKFVSFTYNDEILRRLDTAPGSLPHDPEQRNVGVAVPWPERIETGRNDSRNHDGNFFTVLVTTTVASPEPGSDEISKAYEDAWVGVDGYVKPDGTRQRKAIAFLGDLISRNGNPLTELFVVDLPETAVDFAQKGNGPLGGTKTRRPFPPNNVRQRRLTYTADRKHPGVRGPRHWVRSSPDGSGISFLFRDDNGIIQIGSVSPNGGPIIPLTQNPWSVESAFGWSPDGTRIAFIADRSVFVTFLAGKTIRLTPRSDNEPDAPLPLAVVFSPDGKRIAFQRNVPCPDGRRFNQIFTVETPSSF